MRTRHHFGLNVQVQLLLMTIFFFLLPNAAPYLSLIFDSLLDLGEFRGKSTYIQHPGTAEPFRIAPAEPVAYTNLVKQWQGSGWYCGPSSRSGFALPQ